MLTPTRTLIGEAHDLDRNRPDLTPRQRAQRDRILNIGQTLMARHGTHALTVQSLAAAIGISTAAFRRHFYDLDTLLAEILMNHLHALVTFMAEVPVAAPDCFARRRVAYFAYTRGTDNRFTDVHTIMVRDRSLLPEEEWNELSELRHQVGAIIAGDHGQDALALLDTQRFDLRRIEAALAAITDIDTEDANAAPEDPAPQDPAKVTWLSHLPADENSQYLGDLSRISGVTAPAGLVFERPPRPSG